MHPHAWVGAPRAYIIKRKETFRMNKTKKLSGIYLFILFLATAVPTVLRTVALLQNFDYRSGYFSDGKTLITAAGITVSALVLLLLTFAFTAQMPTKLRASFNTPATYIPVGAVGAALIFFAADAYVALRAFDMPILLLIKMKDSAAITSLSLTPARRAAVT